MIRGETDHYDYVCARGRARDPGGPAGDRRPVRVRRADVDCRRWRGRRRQARPGSRRSPRRSWRFGAADQARAAGAHRWPKQCCPRSGCRAVDAIWRLASPVSDARSPRCLSIPGPRCGRSIAVSFLPMSSATTSRSAAGAPGRAVFDAPPWPGGTGAFLRVGVVRGIERRCAAPDSRAGRGRRARRSPTAAVRPIARRTARADARAGCAVRRAQSTLARRLRGPRTPGVSRAGSPSAAAAPGHGDLPRRLARSASPDRG